MTRGVDCGACLDLVLLSSEGKASRLVDELRIGPTWLSVAALWRRVHEDLAHVNRTNNCPPAS